MTRQPSAYALAPHVGSGTAVIVDLVPPADLFDEEQSAGEAIVAGYNCFALEWTATDNHDIDVQVSHLDPLTLANLATWTVDSVSHIGPGTAHYYVRFGAFTTPLPGRRNSSGDVWCVIRVTLFCVAAFPFAHVRGTLHCSRR